MKATSHHWILTLLAIACAFVAVRWMMVLTGFEKKLLPHTAIATLAGLVGGTLLIGLTRARNHG